MARYKIGTTEAGDAGLDLSWVKRLRAVDGAIIITKQISPKFHDAALEHKDKIIIHATCTGYGHTILEPNVPSIDNEFNAVMNLVAAGFPKQKIVIRVDPIIPTPKGINRAMNVIKMFMDAGFSRFRVSIIDMYPHVRERFMKAGLPPLYGDVGFSPSAAQVQAVDKMLMDMFDYWKSTHDISFDALRIESCAEPELTNVVQCGCVSAYDLELLGLSDDDVDSVGYQRPNCLCYSGKTELLKGKKTKQRCDHRCLYCFWK